MSILITGASRGIGHATALLAAKQGWHIGINYLSNESAVTSTLHQVQQQGGSGTLLQGDISQEADVLRIFSTFTSQSPPLRGVVINAGITAPSLPLIDISTERLRKTFDTNILGASLTAREAAKNVINEGSIVLVSSKASVLGSANEYVDYAGAKGAVDTLTIGLAKELGPERGIRVNAVRPGAIETTIHEQTGDVGRVERLGKLCPLRRSGKPEEVAEAIIWLLSEKSSYITGALLDVSGGR